MTTFSLSPETNALKNALRAEFVKNDTSAISLAIAIERHLLANGFALAPCKIAHDGANRATT